MTVNYSQDVATERIGGFFRLLFRWRGSIYQAIYGEIGLFLVVYFLLSFLYRFALEEPYKTTFELVCIYCEQFADSIPVTFILGFYLVRVIGRRWSMWENMPWPDRVSLEVSIYVRGDDVKSRLIRRTLVRYVNLGAILCFRDICLPVRKRFPKLEHLVTAGLMTPEELKLYTKIASKRDNNWWIPFHWAYTLLQRASQEGRLTENILIRLLDAVLDMRNRCWVLFSHDWIPVPIIYTQVCTLAVHLFMIASLLGRQYLDPSKKYPTRNLDLYFPYFTFFQLIFYLGWLKVGEVFINPLGHDADDFDVNYIVERNIRVAYTMVDDNYNKLPPIEKDKHWDFDEPFVPNTAASLGLKDTPFIGSAINMQLSESQAQQVYNETMNTTASQGSDRPLIDETNVSQISMSSRPNVFGRFFNRQRSADIPSSSINDYRNERRTFSLYRKKSSHQVFPDRRARYQPKSIRETNENLFNFIGKHD